MRKWIGLLTLATLAVAGQEAQAICNVKYSKSGESIAVLEKKYPRASMRAYKMKGVKYTPFYNTEGFVEKGEASWYGRPFHGRKTASGETYNMFQFTAAHPTLPIPSCVKVTNLQNGKTVVVRVNDRGPYKSDLGTDTSNRIIDLSLKAAVALDFRKQGVTDVKIEVLPTEIFH
jgi:rare lipoprotein A